MGEDDRSLILVTGGGGVADAAGERQRERERQNERESVVVQVAGDGKMLVATRAWWRLATWRAVVARGGCRDHGGGCMLVALERRR